MDIFKEITTVKNPTSVAFIDDFRVVIGGDKCVIETLFNPDSVQIIDKSPIFHIAMNKNQTRFAVSSEKKLAVYGFNGKQLWLQHTPLSSHATLEFDAISPILFAYVPGRLTTYNYVEKTVETHAIPSYFEYPSAPISCHPTQQKILYPSSENTFSTIHCARQYTIKLGCTTHEPIVSGTYNSDGDRINVIYDQQGFSIYNPITNFRYNIPITKYPKKVIAAAFHPHYLIIAVLFDNNALQYWNYKTMELLADRLHSQKKCDWFDDLYPTTERLSFSPDGKKLIVAFKNKCTIFHVPCRTFILIIYWLFKKHQLPVELIRPLIDLCFRTCQFHNYNLAELIKT
jgi:WD40 repeat protein